MRIIRTVNNSIPCFERNNYNSCQTIPSAVTRCLWNLLILVDFFAELSIILNKNRNVLDVRASLKVGLQMEQDNFPSH